MKAIILNVKGMACGGCENRIQNVLKNIEGVEKANADHNTEKVTINISKDISKEILKDAIEDIGYEVAGED